MLSGAMKAAGGTLLNLGLIIRKAEAKAAGYGPKLSVEGYIWIQRFDAQKKTIAEGVEEALAAFHRAGYRRVELSSDFFKSEVRAKTLELLSKYHLRPETTYAGSTMHEPQAAQASVAEILELAKALKPAEGRWIVTNPMPKPNRGRKSDQELTIQAEYVNQLGRELRQLGFGLMIHHHTPELVDNAREWRHLLRHTDPQVVSCCVDVDWAVRGGQDPIAFLREVGSRLESLHLRNDQQGVWMEEFGPGDIDYRKVSDYLHKIKFGGYLVVELAYEKNTHITRPLEEDLRRSRFYAEKVFGLNPA
jgi:sugar phosphate isomerase/epimerase